MKKLNGLWRAYLPVAASLLGTASMAPANDDIGKLFFSPAERVRLDLLRNADVPAPASEAALTASIDEPSEEEFEPVVRTVTEVEGYVARRRALGTAWVNGQQLTHGTKAPPDTTQTIYVRQDGVLLAPLDGESPRLLKPGQRYDPNAGQVVDLLSGSHQTPP